MIQYVIMNDINVPSHLDTALQTSLPVTNKYFYLVKWYLKKRIFRNGALKFKRSLISFTSLNISKDTSSYILCIL